MLVQYFGPPYSWRTCLKSSVDGRRPPGADAGEFCSYRLPTHFSTRLEARCRFWAPLSTGGAQEEHQWNETTEERKDHQVRRGTKQMLRREQRSRRKVKGRKVDDWTRRVARLACGMLFGLHRAVKRHD